MKGSSVDGETTDQGAEGEVQTKNPEEGRGRSHEPTPVSASRYELVSSRGMDRTNDYLSYDGDHSSLKTVIMVHLAPLPGAPGSLVFPNRLSPCVPGHPRFAKVRLFAGTGKPFLPRKVVFGQTGTPDPPLKGCRV